MNTTHNDLQKLCLLIFNPLTNTIDKIDEIIKIQMIHNLNLDELTDVIRSLDRPNADIEAAKIIYLTGGQEAENFEPWLMTVNNQIPGGIVFDQHRRKKYIERLEMLVGKDSSILDSFSLA